MKTILGHNLVSIQEAADLLECSKKTISRKISAGLLIDKIIDGRKYILEKSISDYLTTKTITNGK